MFRSMLSIKGQRASVCRTENSSTRIARLTVEVITAEDEQKQILWAILWACHANATSGHFRVKKTAGRITE